MVPALTAALGGGLKGALGATVLGGVAGGLSTGIASRIAGRLGGNAGIPYSGSMVGPSIFNSAMGDIGRSAHTDQTTAMGEWETKVNADTAARNREAERSVRMAQIRSAERIAEKEIAARIMIAASSTNQRAQEFSRALEQDNYVQQQRNLPIWIRAWEAINPWNYSTSTPAVPTPPPPPEMR